jgi:beta-glucosidase
MLRKCLLFMFIACSFPSHVLSAQQKHVDGSGRVDQLLQKMTLDEKIAMIHGTAEDPATYQGQAGYLPGIARLGIPPVRFADGPPGVLTRVPSTALTSTMGLAATFSRADAKANGILIGREARSHGIGVALQPFINIARDFSFGRAYNTFGEDPLLTGQLAAAEIEGIQSEHVLAQAKHYIGYDTDATDVIIDQQTLHEIYAAPFDCAVKAGVASIMCSYNKINGAYACGNKDTLMGILRHDLGFKGFVTSDWGAVHATDFINAGTNLEMPGPLRESWAGPSYFVNGPVQVKAAEPKPDRVVAAPLTDRGLPEEPLQKGWQDTPQSPPTTDLKKLLAEGKISEETITAAARTILLQMERFGFLDGKEKLDVTPSDVTANAAVIEKTAEDAAVLLKNEDAALPLKQEQLRDLVLIGPGANQTIALGMAGEKAVGLPGRAIGTLAALKQLAPAASATRYAVADDMEGVPVPAAAFSHDGEAGLVVDRPGVPSARGIDYTLLAGTALPADSHTAWVGTIKIPETGKYRLHLQVLGCYATLTIDHQIVAKNGLMWIHGDITQGAQDNILPTLDGLDNLRASMDLTAGSHTIHLNVIPDSSHAPEQVRFNWVTPSQKEQNYRAAIDAAKHAKTAVVFVWSRGHPVFELPGDQDKLIHDVAAVNPNTIIVLNVSQPVAMPWLGQVKAVLQMWWPGDEGGWATAKVLLGQVSPGGRLPFTWEKQYKDTPAGDASHPERSATGVDGKTTFSEGILVGYRWFDAKNIDPLFPFGFGLSYSRFNYSALRLEGSKDGGIDATLTVKNTGNVAADEVAQVYVDKPNSSPEGVQFAERILGGFERVHLEPGSSRTVQIHVPLRLFQYWSTATSTWVAPAGSRTLSAGGASRERPLSSDISLPNRQ